MKRVGKLSFVILFTLTFTTGCWNLKEPNQLSFVTGTGLDLTEDNKLEVSALIAIPAGIGVGQNGGSRKESFRVMSGTGKNVSDAVVNMQSKLSRTAFPGHRDIILIGHRLVEHGIGDTIDPFVRNAQSEMRSMIYIVKNSQAKEILSIDPFFDPVITTSLSDEQEANGLKPYLARDFVMDVLSEGTQPLLPMVGINASKHYTYNGSAIVNKEENVKLVGYLNKKESIYANWIKDRLIKFTITNFISKGDGNVSVSLFALGQQIDVKKVDDRMKIDVHLTGKGTIIENNTNLDPSKRKDLQHIQNELDKKTEKSIQQLIKKVQKEYKMDIFGFGEIVHRQHPPEWKTLKQNWSKTFSNLQVSVKVDLQCKDPGQTNLSIQP